MKVLLVIASLVVLGSCAPLLEEWESWKMYYNRKYDSKEEELQRQVIWQANKKYVEEHNAHKDKFGYSLKMNQFADMSVAEFARIYNGFRIDTTKSRGNKTKQYVPRVNLQIPSSWDWRQKGYVTEVKNQGQCGSCWAFATTGSLEGRHYKATGNLVSLSEQQLVDCAGSYGNHGCKGGNPDRAFQYIEDNGGIDTEASYPYQAEDGECAYNSANVGATCSGYTNVPTRDESALLSACYTVGPIAVAMDASHKDFQFYSSGVYSNSLCSSTVLDHGVLAVGWGNYSGQDYWLVKNSWGTDWGLEGYFMLARNQNNMCGVATMASYPLV